MAAAMSMTQAVKRYDQIIVFADLMVFGSTLVLA